MHDSPRFTPLVLAVAMAVAITACSDDDANEVSRDGSGENADPEAAVVSNRLGVVRLASRSPATVPAASAAFLALQDGDTSTLETVRAQLMPAAGTCLLESDTLGAIIDGAAGLDAGEVLTLTDANGTYAGVERSARPDGTFVYRLGRGTVAAPSGELVLDIPGGDSDPNSFPAIAATSFPTVERAPSLLSPPALTGVSTDTVYRWGTSLEQGSDERPFLLIVVNAADVLTNSILCALPENGEFVLPDATIAALEARNEIGVDGTIGTVFGFGAMRIEERRVDEGTRLLMRHMRFTELPRS